MSSNWSNKWKKALIWFSGYISFIAYALVGGYTIVKSEDEELKKTAKLTFFVTLVFAGISALLSIFNYCGGMSDSYYGSSAYDFYSIATRIVSIAQIIVYAAFVILSLFQKENKENKTNEANTQN